MVGVLCSSVNPAGGGLGRRGMHVWPGGGVPALSKSSPLAAGTQRAVRVVAVFLVDCYGGRGDGSAVLQGPRHRGSGGLVLVGSAGWWWRHSLSLIQTMVVLDLGLALGQPTMGPRRVGGSYSG